MTVSSGALWRTGGKGGETLNSNTSRIISEAAGQIDSENKTASRTNADSGRSTIAFCVQRYVLGSVVKPGRTDRRTEQNLGQSSIVHRKTEPTGDVVVARSIHALVNPPRKDLL